MKKLIATFLALISLNSMANENRAHPRAPHEILSHGELELLKSFHQEQDQFIAQERQDVQNSLISHMRRYDSRKLMTQFLKLSQSERLELLTKAIQDSSQWRTMNKAALLQNFSQWLSIIPGPPDRRPQSNF